MRYWYDENAERAFALEVPPPDGDGIYEINEELFNEVMEAHQPPPLTAAEKREVADGINTYMAGVEAGGLTPVTEGKAVKPVTTNMEQLAKVWRKMDDKIAALTAKYEADKQEIEDQQKLVSTELLKMMNELGGTKLMTASGEIEKKAKRKVSGRDWGAFYRFIVENDAFHFLHKRIASTAVDKYMEDHQDPDGTPHAPPGVDVYTEYVINVKKPAQKRPTEE